LELNGIADFLSYVYRMAQPTNGNEKDIKQITPDKSPDKQVKEEKVDCKEVLLEDARMEFRKLMKEAHSVHRNDVLAKLRYVTERMANHFKILAEAYIGDQKAQDECWDEYMKTCDARLHICTMRVSYWLGTIILPDGLQGLREAMGTEIWSPKISELQMLQYCFVDADRDDYTLDIGEAWDE
jgi:hypothetical protein